MAPSTLAPAPVKPAADDPVQQKPALRAPGVQSCGAMLTLHSGTQRITLPLSYIFSHPFGPTPSEGGTLGGCAATHANSRRGAGSKSPPIRASNEKYAALKTP